ncbi:uncharacterized protein LOC130208251 isoform X3 [Pseudoliparis swirei]|uniref:uncharacterized protein LOC130208251 isoform X3 n=1 Tax=Pseudoliparis swirei TaxID=2059687 RepID=UPI0024BEEC67|nr:uncharacterized protein LOC130208251 isoform X3 [Pseudoliparis swirei]
MDIDPPREGTADSLSKQAPRQDLLVLDTNILISHLDYVKKIKAHGLGAVGFPIVLIPWVVLQELDSLKKRRGTSSSAARLAPPAMSYINACLTKREPKLWGQSMQQDVASSIYEEMAPRKVGRKRKALQVSKGPSAKIAIFHQSPLVGGASAPAPTPSSPAAPSTPPAPSGPAAPSTLPAPSGPAAPSTPPAPPSPAAPSTLPAPSGPAAPPSPTAPSGPAAPPSPTAPSQPAFQNVHSLLRTCSGHRSKRYQITVEEIRRRTAPPESMSINTLTALLRTDNNLKRDLREQLQEVGVTPGTVTKVTSLCSKLSEGTVQFYSLFL